MKIDLYTKAVLTIIAGCLLYLSFGRPAIAPTVQAQAEPTRVIVAGWVDFNGRVHSLSQMDSTSAIPVIVAR